jgi:D-aspartate ligase
VSARALPPALLTMANYYGTLAAVRSLGRQGIRVTTADPSRLGVSAWSRFTCARVRAPHVQDSDRFIAWLIAYGRQHGKHVLLPSSDDTAWLYALHREALSEFFHLSSPPFDVIAQLLNKRLLYANAVAAGLQIPRTWFPQTDQDLRTVAAEARFPVVIKPVTQVMFRSQIKGFLVDSADMLESRYRELMRHSYTPTLLNVDPSAARPMVQEFFPDAATGIYNISAYVRHGHLVGARGARKLLQQPRRVGTGVCFQEAPVIPALAAGLDRLVSTVGFSGVFEAEFIDTEQGPVLIDFNPRFYNQMGFDIARGLPLPLLAYFDAIGRQCPVPDDSPSETDQVTGRIYVDLFSLRLILFAQRWSRAVTGAESEKWRHWYQSNRHQCTYAVLDADDRVPAILAALQMLGRHARHPRHFVKSVILNRF